MVKKLKVAFLINTLYTNTFINLFHELEADKDAESRIYSCSSIDYDFAPGADKSKIADFLNTEGLSSEQIDDSELIRQFNPDFIFASSPYDMYRPKSLSSTELSSFAKLAHISYGASMLNWTGAYQSLANNLFYNRSSLIFIESNMLHKNRNNFVSVGYTKLDSYLYYKRSPINFDRFSVAWKPRWTEKLDTPSGILKNPLIETAMGGEILLNFIVHPLLFSEKNMQNLSPESRLIVEKIIDSDHINLVNHSNFLDYVLGSDLFIGDASSTLAEFVSTERPIIYTGNGSLNSLGKAIVRASYSGQTRYTLNKLLYHIMSGKDYKSDLRVNLFNRLFDQDEHLSSSLKIKNHLINQVN